MPFPSQNKIEAIRSAQAFADQRRAELKAAPPSNNATPDQAIAAIVAGLAAANRKAA